MIKETTFDYIIIGGGLAGMQLALAFCEDSFFSDKRVAIMESNPKTENDKTWCYWEKGSGKWDKLVDHQWKKSKFHGPSKSISMDLGEYSYKMLPSLNFYNYAKSKIETCSNISWIAERVVSIEALRVLTEQGSYDASLIFDSRVSSNFHLDHNSITLLQPFKGWVIETEEEAFDPDIFTFMDYRLTHENTTCFTYILPVSSKKALVEFTFFVPEEVNQSVYDERLKEYIKRFLKIESYTICEVEQGVIPMSSFSFWNENSPTHLKIGTGGGWVKASTGYSFKNVEKKVSQLVESLKVKELPKTNFWQKRFRFYDKVLLNILHKNNSKGPEVFQRLYEKNEAYEIFKFLDEDTTFAEELKIMWNTDRPLFVKSVINLLKS